MPGTAGSQKFFERACTTVTETEAEAEPSLVLGQSQHAAKYWDSESTPPMRMPHNPKFPAFGQVAIIDALTEPAKITKAEQA